MDKGGAVHDEAPTRSPYCSGVCEKCLDVNNGSKNWYLCPDCYDEWQSEVKAIPFFIQKTSLKGGLQPTVGHIKDIKSRKLAEDGRHVVRDSGKNPIYFGG